MNPVILTVIMLTNIYHFEMAVTESQRETGMMFRKSWGQIDGMIFVNPGPSSVSFWMKNTYVPLTMYFMDNKMDILETYNPAPLSTSLVTSSNSDIEYVLEFNPLETNIFLNNYSKLQPVLLERVSAALKTNQF